MIYVYRKDGLIQLSQYSRNLNSDEYVKSPSELLYVFPWYRYTLDHVYQLLRPWKKLDLEDGWFKEGVIEVLEDYKQLTKPPKDFPQPYKYVYKPEIDIEFAKFQEYMRILILLGKIENSGNILLGYENIKYTCDIPNYLEDIYGTQIFSTVSKFSVLSPAKKQFLVNFSKILTKEKRISYINENIEDYDWEDIITFLPSWYQVNLKVFGLSIEPHNYVTTLIPEYLDNSELEIKKSDVDLKLEIYNRFSINTTYTGEKILEILKKIYNKAGITKTPRISDLFVYFEITPYRGGDYRINFRKVV